MGYGSSSVTLSKGVPSSNEGYRFLVIHVHSGKCGANLLGGFERVGITAWTFGVNIYYYVKVKRIGMSVRCEPNIQFFQQLCKITNLLNPISDAPKGSLSFPTS